MAFIDTEQRQQGEVGQKVGRLKLSAAIRECGYGEPDSLGDCVLGRAYTKLTGRTLHEAMGTQWCALAALAFGVSVEVTKEAERQCYRGIPHSSIADWLESQGL